jgi:hypothetical protein
MGELGRNHTTGHRARRVSIRRTPALLVLAIAVGVALVPQPSPALLDEIPLVDRLLEPILGSTTTTHDLASDEGFFVQRVNEERAKHGLRTLTVRSDLVTAAREQARKMADGLEIWHNPDLGDDVAGWITIGENVGWSRTTIADLHVAFMESPEHRENILWPAFNEVGMGEAIGSDGRIFLAQMFAERRTTVKTPQRAASPRAATPRPVRTLARADDPIGEAVPPQTVSLLLRIIGLDA